LHKIILFSSKNLIKGPSFRYIFADFWAKNRDFDKFADPVTRRAFEGENKKVDEAKIHQYIPRHSVIVR